MRTEFARRPRTARRELVHRGTRLTFLTAECSDGKWIQMSARLDHHFAAWMRAIGLADVLEDGRYRGGPLRVPTIADIEELDRRIRERMLTRSQAEWMQVFIDADVGADPFFTPDEFLAHPQMVDNGRVVELRTASGAVSRQVGPLARLAQTPAVIERAAPGLGQDTEAVLARRVDRRSEPSPIASAADGEPPLSGLTVVELAYFFAAPLAGSILAELGARVIKIEPPDGDPLRLVGSQAAPMLHGKESLAVDLKQQQGRAILGRLLAGSDVFFTSLRPHVHRKLGCDYETARALNPALVYLYAGSYGSRGPWAGRAAFHSTPNALVGAGILQAGAGNPPVDDGWPDPISGLALTTAILLGLAARDGTGVGQYVETTMLCSSAYAFSRELLAWEAGGWRVPDAGQHGRCALDRLYRCRSGWLFLQVVKEREWVALAESLGRSDWLRDERFASPAARDANDAVLTELVAETLGERSSADWERRLAARAVPAASVYELEFLDFMRDYGQLSHASHPSIGDYWRLPPRFDFSAAALCEGPVCGLGEHSRQLLEELDYGAAEIEQLVAAGVIVDGERNEHAAAVSVPGADRGRRG
jgi:crotonobetainyl-CoA:carnitine CoA-transferase CaiB-like acyl-CoA transferase